MKTIALLYGILAYIATGVVVAGLALFLADRLLPKTINSSDASPLPITLLANLGLLSLFGLQHSGMARRGFKRYVTQLIPEHVERSTYVWCSNAALVALMLLWRPWPVVIWDLSDSGAAWLAHTVAVVGVAILTIASFQIDHASLMGLRQVWDHYRGRPPTESPFRTPGLYRIVRHPLMLGLLLALWACPLLTAGRLLFNTGMTAYIVAALIWEERDLRRAFGSAYSEYQRRVPRLLPIRRPQ